MSTVVQNQRILALLLGIASRCTDWVPVLVRVAADELDTWLVGIDN
jgi:hypothetical protein